MARQIAKRLALLCGDDRPRSSSGAVTTPLCLCPRARRKVASSYAFTHDRRVKPEPKKRLKLDEVWREAKDLVWARRGRLAAGLALMLVNRLAGLVLPATSKYLIDDVIGKGQARTAAAARAGRRRWRTLVQAVTSFALSQVLGVAAQRAITEMRKRVEAHVLRLPVRYFDSTKTGVLISRIMTDAEGIRNLVGTGLVQLVGSIVTAVLALGVLFYLNWKLTLRHARRRSAVFGGVMAIAFKRAAAAVPRARRDQRRSHRPPRPRRSAASASSRPTPPRSARSSSSRKGVHKLFRNIAKSITGVSGDRRRSRR